MDSISAILNSIWTMGSIVLLLGTMLWQVFRLDARSRDAIRAADANSKAIAALTKSTQEGLQSLIDDRRTCAIAHDNHSEKADVSLQRQLALLCSKVDAIQHENVQIRDQILQLARAGRV